MLIAVSRPDPGRWVAQANLSGGGFAAGVGRTESKDAAGKAVGRIELCSSAVRTRPRDGD